MAAGKGRRTRSRAAGCTACTACKAAGEPGGQGDGQAQGEQKPGRRAEGGGQGVVDRGGGRAVDAVGEVGQREPAADRHRHGEQGTAEGRAQAGRGEGAAAAGGDGDTGDGEDDGRERQPERGGVQQVEPLRSPATSASGTTATSLCFTGMRWA
ncbi:hypothetical protein SHKM778_01330 [Streptomyces sp. KM77-8]|uniref:Uncharacterized protein n=1 Tax=Streptomyces haneummycinicus TaxID=3074435 RepID=A0AAT9H8Q3_9ACTN